MRHSTSMPTFCQASVMQGIALTGRAERVLCLRRAAAPAMAGQPYARRLSCGQRGPIRDTALQILKILPHLLQRKSQCEKALGGISAQGSRQALLANGDDFGTERIEEGSDGERRRCRAPGPERAGALTKVISNRAGEAGENGGKARLQRLG